MNTEIILGVVMFTVIVLALVAVILAARSKLVSTGDVTIEINDAGEVTNEQLQTELLEVLDVARKSDAVTFKDTLDSVLLDADGQTRAWANEILEVGASDDHALGIITTPKHESDERGAHGVREQSSRRITSALDELTGVESFDLDSCTAERCDVFTLQHASANRPITFCLHAVLCNIEGGALGGAAKELGLELGGLLSVARRLDDGFLIVGSGGTGR